MKKMFSILGSVFFMAASIYAMGTPPSGTQPQQGSNWLSIAPLIFILIIFYFLILFPQRQNQKKQMDMIKNLKNGDKIITSSGIHGSIIKTNDATVTIQTSASPRCELTIEKSAIGRVVR